MPVNVEIKARVRDAAALRAQVESLGGTRKWSRAQEDVFFPTRLGRLKLRSEEGAGAELIYYQRRDGEGPKRSDYRLTRIPDPNGLRAVLAAALGERGVVRKRRTLHLLGQTRIHLDEVEGLGSFLELEVMLAPGQSDSDGEAIARALMARLGVAESDLVDCAYMDLLEGGARP